MRRILARVAVVALGFSWGGAGMARADNRPAPKGPDEDGTKPALVKIVLVIMQGATKKNEDSLFAIFGDFLKAAGKAGAVAVIGGQAGSKASGMNLTHTGILGFDADFSIPVLSMTAEDQGQLERYVESGKKVLVCFNVQSTFSNGPAE